MAGRCSRCVVLCIPKQLTSAGHLFSAFTLVFLAEEITPKGTQNSQTINPLVFVV